MVLKCTHTEKNILEAIARGDEKAFTALFYDYHHLIGQYVFSVTRSYEFSEEIVQDVFLKVWDQRSRLKEVNSIKAWIFIITRNYTLNAIRKQGVEKKHREAVEHYLLEDALSQEEFNFDQEAKLSQIMEDAVSSLPPQQQKVFRLRQQGMKNDQIASAMGISPHSAKKYQQLALQAIEKFVKTRVPESVMLFFTLFL